MCRGMGVCVRTHVCVDQHMSIYLNLLSEYIIKEFVNT